MLCAPLVTRDGIFGVLKVAGAPSRPVAAVRCGAGRALPLAGRGRHPEPQRTESLQARMLTAERKHAIAELARTVSHDVNNALGAMLPLIQQMQADLAERKDGPSPVYLEDLEQVQKSLQVCRRIFGGMLSFARGGRAARSTARCSPRSRRRWRS